MLFILRINHNNFMSLNEITPLVTRIQTSYQIVFLYLHNQLDTDIQLYVQIQIDFYGYQVFLFYN